MFGRREIKSKRKRKIKYASSSIGRVAVSKTVGWGFESLLACLTADEIKKLQSYIVKRK